jgi:hypothetical protein
MQRGDISDGLSAWIGAALCSLFILGLVLLALCALPVSVG